MENIKTLGLPGFCVQFILLVCKWAPWHLQSKLYIIEREAYYAHLGFLLQKLACILINACIFNCMLSILSLSTLQSTAFLAVTEMCIVIKEHMSAVCVCVGRGRRPAGRLIKYAGSLEAEWNVAHLLVHTSSLGAWRVMRGVSECVCVCVCVEADLHSEWLHCSEAGLCISFTAANQCN